jgi:hypothetical protein
LLSEIRTVISPLFIYFRATPAKKIKHTVLAKEVIGKRIAELVSALKQGAELSEYTLRLIGSDLEHYIRKLLYDGVIKYNMRSRVLNFSMGKPRIKFNSNQIPEKI